MSILLTKTISSNEFQADGRLSPSPSGKERALKEIEMDYFDPHMDLADINKMSMLALAHIGDGVYELLTRTMLCTKGSKSVTRLHHRTVSLVNAKAQAEGVKKILPLLTEDELAVYKRGRNAKVNSVPQKATVGEYHSATGLEALFGWLYLQGKEDRINLLFTAIMGDNDAA